MLLYILAVISGWYLYRWHRNKQTIGKYGERYVVITGCDSGFGNMLAKKLDELGFHVFAGCLTEQGCTQLSNETSSNVKTVQLDVSKTESIESAFQIIKDYLPQDTGIWGLVNNAGISGPLAPLEWMSRQDFQSVFEVNTLGMVETCRIFLPLILKAKGRVVNMTSVSGRIATTTGPYAASKFAAEGYSDWLRRELYKRGVTVHIVEPGCFKTNITDIDGICRSVESQYNKQPIEIQEYYGEEYMQEFKKMVREDLEKLISPRVRLVVDAYTHALTAKCPHYRYLVGNDARIIIRLLWNLPVWITDFILSANMKIPMAERSRNR